MGKKLSHNGTKTAKIAFPDFGKINQREMEKKAMKKINVALLAASALLAMVFIGCAGSASQNNPEKGFVSVKTPADKLQELRTKMDADNIASGIGIGESKDLQTARFMSADMARAELAVTISSKTQSIAKAYAKDLDTESERIWENGIKSITDQELKGAKIHTTETQVNEATGVYRVFSLVVLDPKLYKKAIESTLAAQKELALRFNASELFKEMDASISAMEKYKE